MSRWIRLSKVLEDDLWDVVVTHIDWECTNLDQCKDECVAKDLGVRPWVSWQAFEKALKSQFEPLSEGGACMRLDPKAGSDRKCQHRTYTTSAN